MFSTPTMTLTPALGFESASFTHSYDVDGFSTRILQPEHLAHMVALQDKVISSLPDEDKNFLLPKTEAHFRTFLQEPYTAIGVFCKDTLVGQTLVAFVQPEDGNKNLTSCPEVDDIIHQPHVYGVLEGVLVDPDFRRRGLMEAMVAMGVDLLQYGYQCDQVYAEVAKDNVPSYKGFARNTFQVVREGVDPSDGCELFYMQYLPKGPDA